MSEVMSDASQRLIVRQDSPTPSPLDMLSRVAVVLLAGLILWIAGDVMLLIFTGILLAIFLTNLSRWFASKTGIGYGWSFACVLSVLAVTSVLLIALFAVRLAGETDELVKTIQKTWQQVAARVQQYEWAPQLSGSQSLEKFQNMRGDWIARIAGIFSTSFGAMGSLLLILFIGIFTAVDPALYRRGLVHLIPLPKRPRTEEVLDELGEKLWWWIIGRLFSMAVVGVATAIGLWLLGIRFAATIGLLSALLTFIPNFGPILSAVPAVLLGLTDGVLLGVYVVILYIGIQAVESNLLTPLIQQKNIQLPPVLNVGFQVLMGVLFGIAGLIVAPPVAVVAMILTQRFYVEDFLGDYSLKVQAHEQSHATK